MDQSWSRAHRRDDRVRPAVDRVAGLDAAAQLAARLLPLGRVRVGEGAEHAREVGVVVAAEVELDREAAEELVEVRVAREDRYGARGRLVDDLVQRAARRLAARRVDDGVEAAARARARRDAAPPRRARRVPVRPSCSISASSSRRCRRSSSVESRRRGSRPAARLRRRGRARTPRSERGEALRRRRPAEREQAQRPVGLRRPVPGSELRHVDAVADPEHLRVVDRVRAAVDAEPDVGERESRASASGRSSSACTRARAARGRASRAARRARGRSGTCARSRRPAGRAGAAAARARACSGGRGRASSGCRRSGGCSSPAGRARRCGR